ncbi:phage tail protein [Clostridium sp. C2-6-12]|uniref:phage tail protein n=1 Tax=Clostridium sp. C2-6-12 TaxID=2698832 RepID=UPI00137089D1|nr:phage tail protein [Clostridium sp. C2-6-12]
MQLGGFAGKLFEVSSNKIYTFDGYSKSFTLNVESQEVDGDKPSSYIKGKGLQDPSFAIKLMQSPTIDVNTEVEAWGAICEAGEPYMLFIGDNPVSTNKYLLKKVDISDSEFFGEKMIKATLKLSFEEYVRAGVKKEDKSKEGKSSKAKKKAKSNGENTMSAEDAAKVAALENDVFGG